MGEDDDNDDSVDGDADNDSNESEEIQEADAQEESFNEEGNPVFSPANIQSLFGDSEDDNGDNESTNEQENTSNTFPVIPIQAAFNMSDNEENDGDEEEEDERWHSASDDINVVCWANRESMPMADVNEMEDTTPDIYDWHIISSENFLDD
ncbi:hypothetical protein OTU49_016580 [Cherax quadricarinatus]|uniref:Uncharacterized protein n=2 Tax=Cherax quadricarinatus TaxID=27406 RepID=A0AAW0YS84_CHEQU